MALSQSVARNSLLAAMTVADFAMLQPHLHRAPLRRLQTLVRSNEPIKTVCFPEDGIVSIVSTVATGSGTKSIEVGIFGREGMSGVAVLLGSDRTPLETFVQVEGTTGLYIDVATLLGALAASSTLQRLLLRYAQVHAVQLAAAVAALASYTVEQRLARWLLMCHDRLDGDDVAITHEFLAMMLGSRRAGVTEALQRLEGEQLVRTSRGHVVVRDRLRLLTLAGASYGQAEAEYRRLIGPGTAEAVAVGATSI